MLLLIAETFVTSTSCHMDTKYLHPFVLEWPKTTLKRDSVTRDTCDAGSVWQWRRVTWQGQEMVSGGDEDTAAQASGSWHRRPPAWQYAWQSAWQLHQDCYPPSLAQSRPSLSASSSEFVLFYLTSIVEVDRGSEYYYMKDAISWFLSCFSRYFDWF